MPLLQGDPVGILHQICSRAAVPAAVAPEEAPQSSEAVTPVKVTRKRKADSYQVGAHSHSGEGLSTAPQLSELDIPACLDLKGGSVYLREII